MSCCQTTGSRQRKNKITQGNHTILRSQDVVRRRLTNITSKIKTEIVLFLFWGGDSELLSREYRVTIADIFGWSDQIIENSTKGFKRKPDDFKLSAAERNIG